MTDIGALSKELDDTKQGIARLSAGHNEEKVKRLALAKVEARETLKKIKTNNIAILELALAMLYLGEGSKKAEETSMGNSDPLILKTFIAILKKVYEIDAARIRCEL